MKKDNGLIKVIRLQSLHHLKSLLQFLGTQTMLYAVAYLSSLAFVAAIFLQMLQNTDELLGIKEKQP